VRSRESATSTGDGTSDVVGGAIDWSNGAGQTSEGGAFLIAGSGPSGPGSSRHRVAGTETGAQYGAAVASAAT